ncbi:hypothetical protein H1R17_01320 [Flavobacterium sp. xlx-214]|uniref:hypothetical protein n=1 Tax=unclassified Flavobacterium TaxID=196869 RepID=UPI0013D6D568|nr:MULTISPECIES: hypothetical protein [unclassified Flavobacterium]MBA5792660.1 hypothetical protein [Flavobacterium sp. xlx-221]QMI83808.1 hypothetical protein H1R17_01320 [Flavobacterium sp. xlx-214]
MKKFLFLLLFVFIGLGTKAQNIGSVKTIQVKAVYDFQDTFNEYRVNSYLKHRLEEKGFTVYYDNQEAPAEVANDPCKLLKCNVKRDKSMLATKLIIELVNCKGEVVFTAKGESRLKARNKSHVDAIKNALEYSTLNKL